MSFISNIIFKKLIEELEAELIKMEPEIKDMIVKEVNLLANSMMQWVEEKINK